MFPDIGSDHNLVENCDISYCSMVGINWEPGNYNVVRNCYVHDLTNWYTNGVKQLTCAAYMWPKGAVASVGNEYYDSTFEAVDYGFSINGGQTTIDGCTIIGKGKNTIGIYMHKADGCKITDNVIRPTKPAERSMSRLPERDHYRQHNNRATPPTPVTASGSAPGTSLPSPGS